MKEDLEELEHGLLTLITSFSGSKWTWVIGPKLLVWLFKENILLTNG